MSLKRTNSLNLFAGLLLLISAQACIIGTTTHSLYLDPNGGISWVVIERDLRSDLDDPADAVAEELGLLTAAQGTEAVPLELDHEAIAMLDTDGNGLVTLSLSWRVQ